MTPSTSASSAPTQTSEQPAPQVEIVPVAAQTVRLHVWGLTDRELAKAVENVRTYPSYHSWTVVDSTQETGLPSPIRRDDPHALGQRANYGWAWAAYPAAARSE